MRVAAMLNEELRVRTLQQARVVEPAEPTREVLAAPANSDTDVIRAREPVTLDEAQNAKIALSDGERRECVGADEPWLPQPRLRHTQMIPQLYCNLTIRRSNRTPDNRCQETVASVTALLESRVCTHTLTQLQCSGRNHE